MESVIPRYCRAVPFNAFSVLSPHWEVIFKALYLWVSSEPRSQETWTHLIGYLLFTFYFQIIADLARSHAMALVPSAARVSWVNTNPQWSQLVAWSVQRTTQQDRSAPLTSANAWVSWLTRKKRQSLCTGIIEILSLSGNSKAKYSSIQIWVHPFIPISAPCGPGTFSSDGFSPCQPCSIGTYQPSSGRVLCYPCPGGGTFGGVPGAVSISECPSKYSFRSYLTK